MFLPEEIKDKFNSLMIDPETMPKICAHVSNGGSLIDLCAVWGVPYGNVLEWVNSTDRNYQALQRAYQGQMYWAIETVLKELKHMGTIDLVGAYNDEGGLKTLAEMPEDVRRCIASIETEELFEGVGRDREQVGVTKKIKVFDKIRALELIGKKFAMFIDRARIDINDKSLEDLIAESMKPEPIDVPNLATEKPRELGTPTPGKSGGPVRSEGPIPEILPDISGTSSVVEGKP